jgi:hypothetical protein
MEEEARSATARGKGLSASHNRISADVHPAGTMIGPMPFHVFVRGEHDAQHPVHRRGCHRSIAFRGEHDAGGGERGVWHGWIGYSARPREKAYMSLGSTAYDGRSSQGPARAAGSNRSAPRASRQIGLRTRRADAACRVGPARWCWPRSAGDVVQDPAAGEGGPRLDAHLDAGGHRGLDAQHVALAAP